MIINPEADINIKDLVLDKPKGDEIILNPDQDITDEDWKKLGEFLNRELNMDNTIAEPFLGMAFAKLFDSQKLGSIVDLEKEWPAQIKIWNSQKDMPPSRIRLENFLEQGFLMKVLYPTQPLNCDLRELNLSVPMDYRGVSDSVYAWNVYIERLLQLKFISPNLVPGLEVNDEMWKKMKETVKENLIDNELFYFREGLWNVAAMRLLAPERWDDPEMGPLKELAASAYQKSLENDRFQGALPFLFQSAFAAKIIVADEVKVTDNGLEVKMAEPKLSQETLLPEARRF